MWRSSARGGDSVESRDGEFQKISFPQPMLIIFGGLPASGKTTIARDLARQLGATYLRIDTIEQAFRECATVSQPIHDEGYRVAYAIAEDRKEDEVGDEEKRNQESGIQHVRLYQSGVDGEGRWLKKAGKLHFGFKKHVSTDQDGLVLGVITTAANVHDSTPFEELVTKSALAPRSRVYSDKAYKSEKHDMFLKDNRLKNGIHYRAYKNRPLTERQQRFNSMVSKTRYTVERTFGSTAKWFGAGVAKYVGLVKTHAQHLLEAIAYNLKRSPNLIIKLQTSVKQEVSMG